MRPVPKIAVVIPTRDRPEALARTLGALARQDAAPDSFEVIVSVDGSSEASLPPTGLTAHPYRLDVVESRRSTGAAGARNRGADRAQSPLLLFIDDDIEATPGLVQAHLDAHDDGADVAIGYLPPKLTRATGLFAIALTGWWEAMFAPMRRPGHRYGFRDLLTGNCSLRSDLFRHAGGFDPRYTCHEDYELGVRLTGLGSTFRFVPSALGWHHEGTTLPRSLQRKVDEGIADVMMLQHHPALVGVLPLSPERTRSRLHRLLRALAFDAPAAGECMARLLHVWLNTCERLRMRGRWNRVLEALLAHAYWQGVASAIRTRPALAALIARSRSSAGPPPSHRHLDLSRGLEESVGQLDRERPASASITWGPYRVGEIPAVPGSEALRGVHLRAALANELAVPLLRALGRARVVNVREENRASRATGPLPREALRL
jgi:GT2 family glycosyltransferase